MKNSDIWKPSKFILRKGRLTSSKDSNQVAAGSRLMCNLIAEQYQEALERHAGGSLLDLGCGKAPLYEVYRNFVDQVTCADWNNGIHGSDYLDCRIDLTEKLPFRSSSFNTIILSDVLEHIPSPEGLWNEMNRVLTPGGKIIMSVPFFYWLHEEPFDYYRYTEFALRRFAEQSGMKIVEFKQIGGAMDVLADVSAKTIIRLSRFGIPLALSIQYFALLLRKTCIGRKVFRATSPSFPMGYFLVSEKI